MKILAIESSCDETAAAVIEDGTKVLSNVVVSQIDIFAVYGGVIPEVAARSHLEAILPVIHKALDDAGLTEKEIDAIAVTHTPGLLGSLLIGTLTARTLAILWQKSLYAVHHLKSHIYANWLTDGGTAPEFPLLALVVSGGHTQIIYMPSHNQFEIIGTTRDDAVGECFDKVAKILGLPYPGGPSIAKVAKGELATSSSELVSLSKSNPSLRSGRDFDPAQPGYTPHKTQPTLSSHIGNPRAYRLPHPKVEGLDFSFSGLKTAVLRAVQAECGLPITTPSYKLKNHLSEQQKADFAAAFQETAADILIERLKMALGQHPEAKSVVLAGGVSANQVLRQKALEAFQEASNGNFDKKGTQKTVKIEQETTQNRRVYFPDLRYTGDNAAMVGVAAFYEIMSGVQPTDPYKLNIAPRTSIETVDNLRD